MTRNTNEFNYEVSFDTVAVPMAAKVFNGPEGKGNRTLFEYVREQEGTLGQQKDTLEVSPTASEGLRKMFAQRAALDPLNLSILARVTYFLGHHGYPHSDHYLTWGSSFIGNAGATWKLAHMADEALTKHLGLTKSDGGGFKVHDGALRFCISKESRSGRWEEFWVWEEIGTATPTTLATAKEYLKTCGLSGGTYEGARQILTGMQAVCLPLVPTEYAELFTWPDRVYCAVDAYTPAKQKARIAKRLVQADEVLADAKAKCEELMYEAGIKASVLRKGFDVGNLIHYATGWVWGWYKPCTQEESEAIRSAGFEFDFTIKMQDGTNR